MIFYFSATGNSCHVAQQISQKTGERIISITDCLKSQSFYFEIGAGENIGFITPTYNWGLPVTVIDFIEKLNIKTDGSYVFTVATFGTATGGVSKMLRELLKNKGIDVDAHYSVRMPDTWTPVFDLSNKERNERINRKADVKISRIIAQIKRRAGGNYDFWCLPFYKVFYKDYDIIRRTDSLSVNGGCTGCGLCEKQCPVNAIEIRNGKPVWVKDKCAMCLGCLHRCPKFAVQRGSKTALHGQYVHKLRDDIEKD